MKNISLWCAVVVVAIISIIGLFSPQGRLVSSTVKGLTNTNSLGVNDLKVGTLCYDSYEYPSCTGTTIAATGAITSKATIVTGGINSTSTNATTETISASDLTGFAVVSITPTAAALTITLPATSTLTTFLPNAGDSTSFIVFDASTVTASSTTFAAGTGTLIENASSTLTINGSKGGTFTAFRKANTDIVFLFTPSI